MYTLVEHPLVSHFVTQLRSRETPDKQFREYASQIGRILAYEAFRELKTEPVTVQTPLCETSGARLSGQIVLVPILRAGLGMLDAVWSMVPEANVGMLGMQRNEETALPEAYYSKLPRPAPETLAVVLDPMLATGGSACDAFAELKKSGYRKLIFLNLISCPEGLSRVAREHPDVAVYTAAVDDGLNERKYILPGLGDAGDRIFSSHDVI